MYGNFIWLANDYKQLLAWLVNSAPYMRLIVFRVDGSYINEGTSGYHEEVGLAGLICGY